MAETVRLCEATGLPQGLRVTTHIADVSDFAQMERFRAEVADCHATDRIHLLFNNAGIRRADEITEHHRQLSAFGIGGSRRIRGCRRHSGSRPWPMISYMQADVPGPP
jgi:NAD(P)-dependent dehydrogenase (short-subunit alcohol dehydrogenase family)